MKHKILIGSIIAVAILVGVSFTSVIGYNTVKSTNGEASPLFNVRASRAINQEDDGLTSDYVGKEIVTTILIPERDNIASQMRKLIDAIGRMDDRTYNRFIDSFGSIICKEIQVKKFGRRFNFNNITTEEMKLFKKMGGYECICTTIVGLGALWTVEILWDEIPKDKDLIKISNKKELLREFHI